MQGLYQGNGAGPVVWAMVSSPVLQIMRNEGFGTFFKTSLSGKTIQLVGYAFVDDTDFKRLNKVNPWLMFSGNFKMPSTCGKDSFKPQEELLRSTKDAGGQ